ncbi:MAG: FHA domain-containing protein, partial [Acidimicrobiia bacterium]
MPELLLRVRHERHAPVDVHVLVEPSHTVADLAAALVSHRGGDAEATLSSLRLGRVLDPDAPLDGVDLLSGDEVLLGRVGVGAPSDDGDGLVAVDVIAGPDAGTSHVVGAAGRYRVGRSPDSAVLLDDRSVSRHHATLVHLPGPGGGTVVHPHPCAANGVFVNGAEITAPTPVVATDVIALGATRLAIRSVPSRIERHGSTVGRIDFHRTPYRPVVVPAPAVDPVGPIPDRPEPRRIPTVVAIAPVLAGLVLFAVTRQLQFLALTLLSPVVLVGSAVEDRRSGRRSHRDRVERFRADLVARRARFEWLRDTERVDRFRAAPDLADLVRRAELRTIDLWARGRAAPDFLSLRLGLGRAATRFAVVLEPGGDDDLRREAATALAGVDELDDVPVTVVVDDVLAVHGEPSLVDGVAASLVVQAATLHSPDDVTIAAAVDRPLDWIRWLPLARSVTSPLPGDHLARSAGDADGLVDRLVEVAERRRAAGVGPQDSG